MADLHNILSKFTELGIENKGLTPDSPTQAGATKTQSNADKSVSEAEHARAINESVQGKHIPGVSDVSSMDMAALAGVGNPPLRPGPATPNPNSSIPASHEPNSRWAEFDTRLSNIENKLNSIFESIQRITEISDEDYREKRKALQDLQANPHTAKDPELQAEIKKRKAKLEKERKETTAESLEKGFASFLKELEDK